MITILSEDQIECRVCRLIDAIDLQLMNNMLSQAEYDREIMLIDKWAQAQYDARRISVR